MHNARNVILLIILFALNKGGVIDGDGNDDTLSTQVRQWI